MFMNLRGRNTTCWAFRGRFCLFETVITRSRRGSTRHESVKKNTEQACSGAFQPLSVKLHGDMTSKSHPALTNCFRLLDSRSSCVLPGEMIVLFCGRLIVLVCSPRLKSVMTARFSVRKGWMMARRGADVSNTNCS